MPSEKKTVKKTTKTTVRAMPRGTYLTPEQSQGLRPAEVTSGLYQYAQLTPQKGRFSSPILAPGLVAPPRTTSSRPTSSGTREKDQRKGQEKGQGKGKSADKPGKTLRSGGTKAGTGVSRYTGTVPAGPSADRGILGLRVESLVSNGNPEFSLAGTAAPPEPKPWLTRRLSPIVPEVPASPGWSVFLPERKDRNDYLPGATEQEKAWQREQLRQGVPTYNPDDDWQSQYSGGDKNLARQSDGRAYTTERKSPLTRMLREKGVTGGIASRIAAATMLANGMTEEQTLAELKSDPLYAQRDRTAAAVGVFVPGFGQLAMAEQAGLLFTDAERRGWGTALKSAGAGFVQGANPFEPGISAEDRLVRGVGLLAGGYAVSRRNPRANGRNDPRSQPGSEPRSGSVPRTRPDPSRLKVAQATSGSVPPAGTPVGTLRQASTGGGRNHRRRGAISIPGVTLRNRSSEPGPGYVEMKVGPDKGSVSVDDLLQFQIPDGVVPFHLIMADRAKVGPYDNPTTGAWTMLAGGPNGGLDLETHGRMAFSTTRMEVAKRIQNGAAQSGGLALTYNGGIESVRSSNHVLKVIMAEGRAAINNGVVTAPQLLEFLNDGLAQSGLASVKSLPDYRSFLRGVSMPIRNKVSERTLHKRQSILPNYETVQTLMTEPDLLLGRNGDISSALYIDPRRRAGPADRFRVPAHPAYEFIIPGLNLGRTSPVNLIDLIPQRFQQVRERIAVQRGIDPASVPDGLVYSRLALILRGRGGIQITTRDRAASLAPYRP